MFRPLPLEWFWRRTDCADCDDCCRIRERKARCLPRRQVFATRLQALLPLKESARCCRVSPSGLSISTSSLRLRSHEISTRRTENSAPLYRSITAIIRQSPKNQDIVRTSLSLEIESQQ